MRSRKIKSDSLFLDQMLSAQNICITWLIMHATVAGDRNSWGDRLSDWLEIARITSQMWCLGGGSVGSILGEWIKQWTNVKTIVKTANCVHLDANFTCIWRQTISESRTRHFTPIKSMLKPHTLISRSEHFMRCWNSLTGKLTLSVQQLFVTRHTKRDVSSKWLKLSFSVDLIPHALPVVYDIVNNCGNAAYTRVTFLHVWVHIYNLYKCFNATYHTF